MDTIGSSKSIGPNACMFNVQSGLRFFLSSNATSDQRPASSSDNPKGGSCGISQYAIIHMWVHEDFYIRQLEAGLIQIAVGHRIISVQLLRTRRVCRNSSILCE
eukprot:scaffold70030_cov61-Attheya_sp.AAC.1